ncbi:SDR family oxidoreductase [bacterium]|nr:SDR family oxidoreductase [bacterium]
MSERIALVIGGNGGIGNAVVKRLNNDGLQVCTTFYNNDQQIKALQNRLGEDAIVSYKCNAVDQIEVKNTVDQIIQKFEKIDVVVITIASPIKNAQLLETSWEEFNRYFEEQVKSIFNVTKALRQQIRSKIPTRFILLSTEYCIGKPPKGLSHYVTAKYAAMGLSKVLALELAQFGSTVNMISPGMVETSLLDNLPPKLVEMVAWENPLKRNATPGDVANAVSFLASEGSNYLNGINIMVNGGNVIS